MRQVCVKEFDEILIIVDLIVLIIYYLYVHVINKREEIGKLQLGGGGGGIF